MRRRDARFPRTRGLTAIEVAVGFAIVGALLAVSIPAFLRELRGSKFVEATSGLSTLGEHAVSYSQGKATALAFPESVALTPRITPRGEKTVDSAGTWDDPTWRALDFRASAEGVPHAFAFSFSSNLSPARSIFAAQAHGDLDGDGVLSTFEVKGTALSGSPAALEPGLYVESEFE